MKKVKPKPNEDVLSLALKHNVSADAVMSHGDNAVHAKGRTRAVLHEDDDWTIPDTKPKEQPVQAGEPTALVYVPSLRRIQLRLHDDHGQLIETDYTLAITYTADAPPGEPKEVYGYSFEGAVDDVISAHVSRVMLSYEHKGKSEKIELIIARLDPVSTIRGIKARLYSLGLYRGEMDDKYDDALRSAVWSFQLHNGSEATGLPDAATLSAIEKAHGA